MLCLRLPSKQWRQHSNPGAPFKCSFSASVKLWTAELAESTRWDCQSLRGRDQNQIFSWLSNRRYDLFSAQSLWFFSDLTLYPRWPLLHCRVSEGDLTPAALKFCALGLQE